MRLGEEFNNGPIATFASILAILGVAYAVVSSVQKLVARRRAKSLLAEFKPAELANRRKVFGRDMAVEELRVVLTKSGRGAVVPVQTGIGGVGKTTLARHYAKTYADRYDRVEFLRAATEQDLIADLAALAKRLDPTLDESSGARALAICAKDMITERASTASWLLIFDNVEKPQLMLDWLIRARNLHTLVTSRYPDWQADGFEAKPLGVLKPDAALDVLRNEAGRDDPGFARLAEDLGFLPLALVQAGEWLRANPRKSAAEYLTRIEHLRQRVAVPGIETQADRTTAAVVELTLASLGRDARVLAEVMAWYAPDALSEGLFAGLADKPAIARIFSGVFRRIPRRVWRVARDETPLRAGFAELRRAALLEDVEDAPGVFRMHRVFQRVIRAQGARRGVPRFAMAESAAALLATQFPYDSDFVDEWPTCRLLLPHVQALWTAAEPLWHSTWGKPGWAAMDYLLNQSGLFLSKQHDLAGAVALGRGSLALMEARLGEEDRDITTALGNLAKDLADLGELAEAQDMFDRAVALDEAHRKGAERTNLALRYLQQANLGFRRMEAGGQVAEGAEALTEAALDKARGIWVDQSGEDSAEMAYWWNQMGYLRRLQGRHGARLHARKRALEITRALPQADRGDLATRAMNYGSTALELGRAEEALGALQEAYDLHVDVYFNDVPHHPELRKAAQWFTACLLVLARKGQGTRAQAEKICARHRLDLAEREAFAARLPLDPVVVVDEVG